jgi:hypothetical protein
MGCRTGFYLTLLGSADEAAVRDAAERALAAVRDHDGPIPGCSPERCGNWRDHSLPGARAWAAEVLERGLIVQPTVLLPARPADGDRGEGRPPRASRPLGRGRSHVLIERYGRLSPWNADP